MSAASSPAVGIKSAEGHSDRREGLCNFGSVSHQGPGSLSVTWPTNASGSPSLTGGVATT